MADRFTHHAMKYTKIFPENQDFNKKKHLLRQIPAEHDLEVSLGLGHDGIFDLWRKRIRIMPGFPEVIGQFYSGPYPTVAVLVGEISKLGRIRVKEIPAPGEFVVRDPEL
jgi:hypothetical protein